MVNVTAHREDVVSFRCSAAEVAPSGTGDGLAGAMGLDLIIELDTDLGEEIPEPGAMIVWGFGALAGVFGVTRMKQKQS